jgi:hypothetical protein
MAERTLTERVEILEQKVQALETLPGRVGALGVQILQLRDEMRSEFSAVRQEMRAMGAGLRDELRAEIRAGDNAVRTEIRTVAEALRAEIRAGDEETRVQMRVLHEEVIARIAALQEGRPRRRKSR